LSGVLDRVESGRVDRLIFGFSPNDITFKGEILTIKEGLRHYKYIKEVLLNLEKKEFYMH
jgi:hypothetical protein